QKQFSPLFPSYVSMMANLLGLRFIAVGVPIEQVDNRLHPGDLRLVARTSDAYIYENPGALHRALLVVCVEKLCCLPLVLFVRECRQAAFDSMMTSGKWPLFDPKQTVLLDT